MKLNSVFLCIFFSLIYLTPSALGTNQASLIEIENNQQNSSILNWNQLIEKLSLKNKNNKGSPFFISFGESHLNQELNYLLYDELYNHIKSNLKNKKFKMCAEPISGKIKESNFYRSLMSSTSKYVEFKQSVSSTQFHNCFEDKYQTYFYYSGFHHQLPLARLYPQSFIASPVSNSWDQSIYVQSKSNGLSFSWIDFSILEEYSLKLALKTKPASAQFYEHIFNKNLNSFLSFAPYLQQVKNNKKLKKLKLAAIQLKISNQYLNKSNFGGTHYFLISSSERDISYAGKLIQNILQLPEEKRYDLYEAFYNSKSLHYFKYNFAENKLDPNSCNPPGGGNNKINCSAQMLSWVTQNDDKLLLIWEPDKTELTCIKNNSTARFEDCTN